MVGTITDTSVTSGYNVSDHKDNEENKSGPDDISVHLNVPKSRKCSVASSQKTLLEKTNVKISENYTSVPYGFQLRDAYEHGKENTDIMGVIYNGRMRQFIILDARGISTWNRSIINSKVSRDMSYPKYEYGLITNIIFARKYNCYFALSKDFSLKVLNKDFEETLSVSADLRCVLFMVFNPITDQLITGGVGGTKIWNFHQVASSFGELKPMANYRLTLKAELADVGGSWVKRVELDHHLQHLYCCSDTNLYAYDLQGKLLFKFIKAHSMSITACKYSIATRFLITSSLDTEVKVWSQMGGLIHTFRGHSRAVTDTLIHPDSSYLFLTCSLDGTVRIWSLDTMDVLYSHVVSGDGVLWMGLTDDKLLYLSTVSSLTLWSLNNVYSFWGLARNKVSQLCLARGPEKTTRVMAVGDDGSVRLFARSSQRNLSTVLPPPSLSPLETILSVTYNREYNIIYMLINPQEIWLYTTRTDPACRVTIWYVNEIQNYCKSHSDGQGFNQEGSAFSQSYRSKSVHRTSISGSGNDPVVDCMCVCTLVSPAMVWTEEGMCSPLQHSYLLLGLEDGRILFMDPIVKNLKHMEFKVSKDKVLQIQHDYTYSSLLTMCSQKEIVTIQIWNLPHLQLQHEVYVTPDICKIVMCGSALFCGHSNGCVVRHELVKAEDLGLYSTKALPPLDVLEAMSNRPDHPSAILALDACPSLNIVCSCSEEGSIKIWDSDKLLLTEIFLGGADHQGEIILSSACFLNNQGDLLVAYLNHIFMIDHTKVYPSADAPDLEEGYFDEESFVLEDSRVLYDDANDEPDSIDLQKYLVPFNIALSEDFLEGRRSIEHVVKEPVDSNDEEEEVVLNYAPKCKDRVIQLKVDPSPMEACDSTCGLSSAPSDIYLSPLTSPRQLSTVDILLCPKMDDQQLNIQKKKVTPWKKLSRKVRQKFLSKARKQPEVTWVEMPQFGSSPGTTPSPSLSSIDSPSPRASSITSDKENEECLHEETQVVEMQGEQEDQSQEGENKMGTKSTSSTPAKQPARQPAKVTDQTYVKSKYSLDNIKVEPPKWAKTQPAPVQPKPFRPSNYTIVQKTEATSPQPKRELKKKLPSNNRKVVTSARSRSRRKSVARSDSQVSGISEVSKDMTAQRVHTPELSGVVESEVSGENGVTHDASDMAYTGNDAARWGEGSQEDVLEASKEMLTQEEQNADLRDDAEKDTALPRSVSASSSTSGPRPLDSTQVVQGGLSKGVTGQGSKDHSPAQHSRPSTAGQGLHDQDELWAMFENTLKHYRSRPGTPNSSELWYKNAGNIFEDSWHERMIERHQLLKLQTMLRVERAAHRRKIEDQRQQERRQSLHSHQHCTSPKMGDGDPDSRLHIFNWFGNANRVSQASGHPSSRLRRPKTAHAKLMGVDKQELSSVQPFRLRMNKSSTELSSKYCSVDLFSYDPRNQWAVRPHSSKSIPAKCRKYVLVQPPKEDGNVVASPMVESLLRKRFPNQLHPVSNPRSRSPTNTYPMSFSALIQQMSS